MYKKYRMRFVINPQFQSLEKQIVDCVYQFDSTGKVLFDGRNQLRKFSIDRYEIVIKSYKKPILINQFIYNWLREPKAERAYNFSLELIKLGISTPQPLSYAIEIISGRLQKSYYACEFINGFEFRDVILQENHIDRELLIRQFTRFTFDLQQKKVFFKDHSPGNTLIRKADDGNYHFYLIDVNRMKFDVEFDLDKRLKNFENLSAPDDVIQIMSDEYAKLIGMNKEVIYQKMSFYAQDARQKRDKRDKRKKLMKKLLGINKE